MKRSIACSSQIRICCEYIDSHPEDRLTLDLLAEKVGYTEHHLSRKFGLEMSCSITDYINKSKMERAKFMLINTKFSIQIISERLGFDSRSYFSYTFRKFTGETPSDYRKENQLI
ncbi:MAG: AraC-type DNA-binding protein [Herbinix sp.]|jgi:AraC-like DNA-binding protein|nr:AraC-type DNA-binding protein [Herbinix sp.]